VSFQTEINLSGLRVISSLAADDFTCEDLKNETTQLAIILYPPDRLNEKFLIKIRQCILKLPEDHPVKRWLKNVARVRGVSAEEQKKTAFLTEILTSRFNLITDLGTKNRIIEVLIDVPENTLGEKFLKSYLYLMIGNVTRSDNILKGMMNTPPFKSWEGFASSPSFYHRLAIENLSSMITKIAKHPSDRKTWELFSLYLKEFMNDPRLMEKLNEYGEKDLDGKLQLLSVERIAPDLVRYLRLKKVSENRLKQRTKHLPLDDQAWWIWYFFKIDSFISEEFLPELSLLEEKNPLWFIYLMENEKLSDFYSGKTGKAYLPGKRQLLRNHLSVQEDFMLTLWKLIELGDIDQKLVNDTTNFLTHD
jgi:hypothetical protein